MSRKFSSTYIRFTRIGSLFSLLLLFALLVSACGTAARAAAPASTGGKAALPTPVP